MPLYTYKCEICNHRFDEFSIKISSFSEPQELPACPKCNNNTKRVLTKPAENPFGTVDGWFKFS